MTEPIERILGRMKGTINRVSGKIDHIEDWTKRQDQRLNHHSDRLSILERFKNNMKGIGIAIAFLLTILGILASL